MGMWTVGGIVSRNFGEMSEDTHFLVAAFREAILRKKLLTFGNCPKVALTPPPTPPILDILGVTFVLTDLGKM